MADTPERGQTTIDLQNPPGLVRPTTLPMVHRRAESRRWVHDLFDRLPRPRAQSSRALTRLPMVLGLLGLGCGGLLWWLGRREDTLARRAADRLHERCS